MVVTSFMVDAGFMLALLRCASRGAALPCTSLTQKATASRGTLARANAVSTSGGKACATAGRPPASRSKAAKTEAKTHEKIDEKNDEWKAAGTVTGAASQGATPAAPAASAKRGWRIQLK
jgi:hypothetical protein